MVRRVKHWAILCVAILIASTIIAKLQTKGEPDDEVF